MSLTPSIRPRILLRSAATALVAGAAVWLALGLGDDGTATAAAAPSTGVANRPMVAKDVAASTSSNWAGYAVTGSTATTVFKKVFAAWVQPAATCVPGRVTYSAFWVGLGGYNAGSRALEQTGTSADCSVTGQASYSVWYELVPAAPVTVKLPIKPGDSIVASVAVSGRKVTVKISNYTRKKTFTKTLTTNLIDVSSAEWIAEAPSACTSSGNCTPLPLTNFGTVTFVSASATAVLLHTGAISGPAWTANAITLDAEGGVGPSSSGGAGANAIATALSSDGSSFGVSWSAAATTASDGPAPPGP